MALMSRPETRINPEVLPNEALLPSQRALLDFSAPTPQFLSPTHKERFKNLIENGIVPSLKTAYEKDDGELSGYQRDQIRFFSTIASDLIDPSVSAGAMITTYDSYNRAPMTGGGSYGTYSAGLEKTFTPEGLIAEAGESFRQKIAILALARYSRFGQSTYSTRRDFVLYTDNLSSTTPFWDYVDENSPSDIFPSARQDDPYFFHAIPHRFANEDTAMFTVTSLAEIIRSEQQMRQERAGAESNGSL